ncbi:hypothetical protein [Methylobacterium sp. V23]|uniref:hypothetical protein n=1 Tax=Methylobacterium sp. V23 TaxID=2044878 RepID=UPI000CDAFB4C|nr:hypothetical protein [Methylobacterium sp. V23]POR42562.1 hypothetical protein CRT23_12290 [Methylobacterium sp. V23]
MERAFRAVPNGTIRLTAVTVAGAAGYAVGSSWMVPGTGDMWRCRSAAVGAARWVKIDVADHPGYNVGRFFTPFGQGAPVAGITQLVGTMYLSYGVIKERITVSQLQARVTTLSAGGNIQLAIYNSDPSTRRVSTLVAKTGNLSTTATGAVAGAFTGGDVTLEPGGYWFACMVDNAVCVLLGNGTTSFNHLSFYGSTNGLGASQAAQPAGVLISGQTFGTWPDDVTALNHSEATSRVSAMAFLVASVP